VLGFRPVAGDAAVMHHKADVDRGRLAALGADDKRRTAGRPLAVGTGPARLVLCLWQAPMPGFGVGTELAQLFVGRPMPASALWIGAAEDQSHHARGEPGFPATVTSRNIV